MTEIRFPCPACKAVNRWESVLLPGDEIDCEACHIPLRVEKFTNYGDIIVEVR